MSKPSRLARTALLANGMVWFGAAVFFIAWALEQAPTVFAGSWQNVLGWVLLVAVGIGLAVVGVIENRTIRRKRTTTAP